MLGVLKFIGGLLSPQLRKQTTIIASLVITMIIFEINFTADAVAIFVVVLYLIFLIVFVVVCPCVDIFFIVVMNVRSSSRRRH